MITPGIPTPDGVKIRVGQPTIVITNPDGSLKSVTLTPARAFPRRVRHRWAWLSSFFGLLLLGLLALPHHPVAGLTGLAMASVIPIAFKRALFAGRAWKAALFVGAANLSNATVGYTASNEVVGTGYTAGGKVLAETLIDGADGITILLDFVDVSWPASSFTARYVLVYDNNAANKEGFVIDMGSDQLVSGGAFTILWPVPDLLTAILQAA